MRLLLQIAIRLLLEIALVQSARSYFANHHGLLWWHGHRARG